MENMVVIEVAGRKRCYQEVVAVGAHKGEVPDSGYFVAYVKRKGEWYLTDDEKLTKINFVELKK